MSVETVIAIVTAIIAFCTSVASFTYNLIQNRKNRIQKIILDNRIKYMNEIREGFTNFIGLTNVKAINLAKSNADITANFTQKLFYGYGKIKTYIKPFYDIDKVLLTALDSLYECVLSILGGEEKDISLLKGLTEDFTDKYLKYDWAYWKYIQRQKEGNYMNSDNAFDAIYYDFVEKLNKN